VSIATLFSAAAHHPPPQVIDTHPHAQTRREQLRLLATVPSGEPRSAFARSTHTVVFSHAIIKRLRKKIALVSLSVISERSLEISFAAFVNSC
jgi:hypothetical protein